MAELGDKKTLYTLEDSRVVETETVCIGFMSDDTPVWYYKGFNRATVERLHCYAAYNDISDNSLHQFESPEDAFASAQSAIDLRKVISTHADAMIEAAKKNWYEEPKP